MKTFILLVLLFAFRSFAMANEGRAVLFSIQFVEYEQEKRRVVVVAKVLQNRTVELSENNDLMVNSFLVEERFFEEVIDEWKKRGHQKIVEVNLSNYHSRRRDSRNWVNLINLCISMIESGKANDTPFSSKELLPELPKSSGGGP